MFIVVDSNRVFSAILSKGKTFDVFMFNSIIKRFEFVAPEFLFFEIGKHFNEILSRSKLSKEEIAELFEFVKEQVMPVSFSQFNMHAEEAEKLVPHAKDIEYFALALKLNAGIWSNEVAFNKQSKVKVFSTSELLKELGLK
mgnify:CR=1 FL=1